MSIFARCPIQLRRPQEGDDMPPKSVLIVGGGITGLSSALHLARRLPPTSKVTLLERAPRVGGWVRSRGVKVEGISGNVTLESGPRTLRPNNPALLELINILDLESRLITIPQTDAVAKARYINIPPLTLLPSSLPSLLLSPFKAPLRTLLPAILREILRKKNRPQHITDESVYSFVARRFGESFARQYLTSIIHGIYAADARNLSVRSAFPIMWDAEEAGHGSVLRGLLVKAIQKSPSLSEAYDTGKVADLMKGISVYTFKGGMETLTTSMKHAIAAHPNVEVIEGAQVISIAPTQTCMEVMTSHGLFTPEDVISTIPLPHLSTLIPSKQPLPHLTFNKSSSVVVVNLVFPPTTSYYHPPGFGYLVPRPATDYPHSPSSDPSDAILGTIFDSAIIDPSSLTSSSSPTKLTVMLGGPYPLDLTQINSPSLIPSLLRTLSSHLSVDLPTPLEYQVSIQKDCIPTYAVGHLDRMHELREALHGPVWKGRLQIIGSGVGGVSMGDCVQSGRDAAIRVSEVV